MSFTIAQLPLQPIKDLFHLFDIPIQPAVLDKSKQRILIELAKIQIYDQVPGVGDLISDCRIFCALVTERNKEELKGLACRVAGAIQRVIKLKDSIQKREILSDRLVHEALLSHFPEDSAVELSSFPLSEVIVPQAVSFVQKLVSISSAESAYTQEESEYIIENALLIPEHLFLLLAVEMPEWSIFKDLNEVVTREIKKLTTVKIVSFLKGEIPYLLAEEQHIKLMSSIGSLINTIPRKWFTTLSLYLSILYSPTEPLVLKALIHSANKEVQKKLSCFLSVECRNILKELQLLAEKSDINKAVDIAEKLVCNYPRGFELLKLYIQSVLSRQKLRGRLAVSIGLKLFYTGGFFDARIPGVKRAIPTGEELLDLLTTIYRNIAERSLPTARSLLRELYELRRVDSINPTLVDLAVVCIQNVACVASYNNPEIAIAIAEEYPEYSKNILVVAFQTMGYRNPDLGIKTLSLVEEKYRDLVTGELAAACAAQNPEKAIDIVLRVENKKNRERVLTNIFLIVLDQHPSLETSLRDKYKITDRFAGRYRFMKAVLDYIQNEDGDEDTVFVEKALELSSSGSDTQENERRIVSLISIVAHKNIGHAVELMLKKLTLKIMVNHARAKIALVCMSHNPKMAVEYLKAIDDVKRKARVKTKLFSEKYRDFISVEIIEHLLEDDSDGFLATISPANRTLMIDKLEEQYMYDKAELLKTKVVL